jgi:exonuclease SbcD
MRVIHTADWHLGQELRGFSRGAEQQRFLAWIVGQCRSREADALVVAGDVFDQANPAAEALGLFFRFAEALRREAPGTTLVAIAGNHDGATRFDALAPALRDGMRLVGAVPRDASGRAGLLVPAGDGHVLAAPYFRLADLPLGPGLDEPGARAAALYRELWDAAPRGRGPCVLTGHLALQGGLSSPESERAIFIGGEQAASPAIFPDEASYVALGHLHRAQDFAGGRVRYSGSPLPMSAAERDYRHRILVVDAHADGRVEVEEVRVPLPVPLLLLPAEGGIAPADAVEALRLRLDGLADASTPRELQPMVEIRLALDGVRPAAAAQLREDIARSGLPARVLEVSVQRASAPGGDGDAPAEAAPVLARPPAEELFRLAFREAHGDDPGAPHRAAFAEASEALSADARVAAPGKGTP